MDVGWKAPDLSKSPVDHYDRWLRQWKNRPSVLRGIDRYLAADESARLAMSEGTKLNDFIYGTLDSLSDVASLGNATRSLSRSEGAPITVEALEGLFIIAAEMVHYLASRGHPLDPEDHTRIAQEQVILREIHEKQSDSDADPAE